MLNSDERSVQAEFSWGSEGPGAYALGHSILTDRLGFPPARSIALDFTYKIILTLDEMHDLNLSSEIVDSYIDAQGGANAFRDDWTEEWTDASETISIETELLPIEQLVRPDSTKPQTVPKNDNFSATAQVVIGKGTHAVGLSGCYVELEPGAVISTGDKTYTVASDGELREVTSTDA
ncbi:MAG: hypothetical protein QXM12_07630 [Nitrososphaerota archaeon]